MIKLDTTDSADLADLAESIVVEAKEILHDRRIIVPDRVMTSLQDVVFWMLMTEATR